jgi:quercetin dioxygenase-like cupin family protein
MYVIDQNELPLSVIAREFIGEDNGGVGISVLLIDAPPGHGPRLHRHAYEEVFIVVPPNTPHRFVNSGDGPLRQIDIHVSSRFVTEWLED